MTKSDITNNMIVRTGIGGYLPPRPGIEVMIGGNTMVLEKVKVILAEQFDVDEDSLQNDTDLQDDLGADSLDVVDLLMSIEDEFEIEIPDEEIENIRTVGELVNYIENNM